MTIEYTDPKTRKLKCKRELTKNEYAIEMLNIVAKDNKITFSCVLED